MNGDGESQVGYSHFAVGGGVRDDGFRGRSAMRQADHGIIAVESRMSLQLLKDNRAPVPIIIDIPGAHDEETFGRIRCPLCRWQPSASSLWCCECVGTPEPFFVGCGTMWNTFSTGGRCPGCHHQWQWTSCLHCNQPSLHADWYEAADPQP